MSLMENERLRKLNIRVLIMLLFFLVVFLASWGFMVLSMFRDGYAPPLVSITWSIIILFLSFLTLLYWYFRTKKLIPLNIKRRRIVFYSALFLVTVYAIIGSKILSQLDVVFGSIVMIAFLIYFISKNEIKGYSTRMLMLLSLGLGIISVHMIIISLYYIITNEFDWNIKSALSSLFAFVPNIIAKFPALMLVLVLFSVIISFVPISRGHKNEVLDS